MKCRHCGSALELPFIDLGTAPPSNAYLDAKDLAAPERRLPLRVMVCTGCWLVQTEDYAGASELFAPDYAYFSSFSSAWLAHAERYVGDMVERFGLGARSLAVEIAANDGYLLQYVQGRGIPCYGVEPTGSTAEAARARGIEIVQEFFGAGLAARLAGAGRRADLIAANNVLAHVPDIDDFVAGFTALLKPAGVATFEFPHIMRLVAENQFDTIYHEHFSYLSLTAVAAIFEANGLTVFDVEEWPTHGGSLRLFARRTDSGAHPVTPAVAGMLARESAAGVLSAAYYAGFQEKADRVAEEFRRFLVEAREAGKSVMAYGAAAKGNTLLNYAGVGTDLVPCVVDRNPAKQGKYLPGSRIPVVDEARVACDRPDYLVILPWNLRREVMTQMAYIRQWGGRFVVAVPALEVLP